MEVLNKDNVRKAFNESEKRNNYDFNCWGATMFCLNQIEKLTWIESSEMIDFLEDCTIAIQSKGSTEYKEGDILVLWKDEEKNQLIHTAVYIGEGKFFHKLGATEGKFDSRIDVKKEYLQAHFSEIRRLKNF